MPSYFHTLQRQIHVEGDFYVFGFGGITTTPHGWGLDVAYINRSDLFWPWGREKLAAQLMSVLAKERSDGTLRMLFLRQMASTFSRVMTHEWHYRRAEQMYLAGRERYPSLARFTSFQQFASECMGGKAIAFPAELEAMVQDALKKLGPDDMERAIARQRFAIAHALRSAVQLRLHELLGAQVGEQLYQQLDAAFPQDAGMQGDLHRFCEETFLSPHAMGTLAHWHDRYFNWLQGQHAGILQALDRLPSLKMGIPAARAALRATAQGLKTLPKPVRELLSALHIPIFVAAREDLKSFRHFYEPGFLVHRETGALHQLVGLGLCVYLPHARGGVFATHGGNRKDARFWHTLIEECTHFTDGPINRATLAGRHRYSSSAAFMKACDQDRATNNFWRISGVLGEKEWAQTLQQQGITGSKQQKLIERIRDYDAILDFDHYEPEKRAAEIFAALPIIEQAVGEKLARKVLHHMFHYYDFIYQPALHDEAASYLS